MAERNRKKPTKRSSAKLAATGTVIRIEPPTSTRKRRPSAAKVIVDEINPIEGFTGFLREYAVVGLSIGFIIGNQMSSLVKIIVENLINPLTQLLFGTALSQRTFTLRLHHRVANFGWGGVVNAVIELILFLIVIYVAFKFLGLDHLAKSNKKK